MRNYFSMLLLLILSGNCYAQLLDSIALSQQPEYTSLSQALKNPDKVYKLNLRKHKLKKIPPSVFTLSRLQELNMSKNRVTEIPPEIAQLKNLEHLNLSRNKLTALPNEIGQLENLKALILNQNEIAALPKSVGNLGRLAYLDMWGNEITKLPREIGKLKDTLKTVDLRVISIREENKQEMEELLPKTKFYFSKGCNCR